MQTRLEHAARLVFRGRFFGHVYLWCIDWCQQVEFPPGPATGAYVRVHAHGRRARCTCTYVPVPQTVGDRPHKEEHREKEKQRRRERGKERVSPAGSRKLGALALTSRCCRCHGEPLSYLRYHLTIAFLTASATSSASHQDDIGKITSSYYAQNSFTLRKGRWIAVYCLMTFKQCY